MRHTETFLLGLAVIIRKIRAEGINCEGSILCLSDDMSAISSLHNVVQAKASAGDTTTFANSRK